MTVLFKKAPLGKIGIDCLAKAVLWAVRVTGGSWARALRRMLLPLEVSHSKKQRNYIDRLYQAGAFCQHKRLYLISRRKKSWGFWIKVS